MSRLGNALVVTVAATTVALGITVSSQAPEGPRGRVVVTIPASAGAGPFDGRLLVMFSKKAEGEPRFQVGDAPDSQVIFGIDVEGARAGTDLDVDASVLGYPVDSLLDISPGQYTVQALFHRYETFTRADGHVVKLPMDRGEGQQWNRAPGNLYSTPRRVTFDPRSGDPLRVTLDKVIPPIPDPPATKYVRHERIRSERLSKFWGRDMYLGAHVLVPEGFDTHPDARYPLVIDHGHFPYTIDGFREQPPDDSVKCEYSARFHWECYNRTEQEYAHQFYRDWTSERFPRFLLIQIQHANPYYDDSYAVNSENLGPYGDAITYELIPYLEQKYRGLGGGWARFMYGGSTGGWEAMGVQIKYPDEYNGAYAACPDPIDFRAFTLIDLYKDRNAYYTLGDWRKVKRPGYRDYLGKITTFVEDMNRLELVLGTRGRSGGQWDIWQAVYSPVGGDGYPKPIWNKLTGDIDPDVAAYWRDNYDLSHILRRDWQSGLGEKLAGKLHIYVGDMDNYYLNNAVYLVDDFLRTVRTPPYGGEIMYGDRAEHCWNGDPSQPNAISRLRYAQMFAPKIVDRLLKTAPKGADVTSWRY